MMDGSQSKLSFNLGVLISCSDTLISNVNEDEQTIIRLMNRSYDDIYLNREDAAEFFAKLNIFKTDAQKIQTWSIQAAELSASSLHENDLHALKSIASNLSINITGQKGFYNQRHMDDYLSPDLINQNVYVVRKIQETLDGLKSIALKN